MQGHSQQSLHADHLQSHTLGHLGCLAPETLAARGNISPERGVVWFKTGVCACVCVRMGVRVRACMPACMNEQRCMCLGQASTQASTPLVAHSRSLAGFLPMAGQDVDFGWDLTAIACVQVREQGGCACSECALWQAPLLTRLVHLVQVV